MKKIIYLLILILPGWSCSDFLDVNPKAEILGKELFRTAEGVEDALYGVYTSLRSSSLYGDQLSCYIPELLCQNFTDNGILVADFGKLNLESDYIKNRVKSIWKEAYSAISYANNIIIHLEEKDQAKFKHHHLYLGEALGIRAFLHFELLRYFAVDIRSTDAKAKEEAIPYVTTYEYFVTPFSSVESVYQSVINDLERAIELLADDETYMEAVRTGTGGSFVKARETHFNYYAALATLARVYWMKGDLKQAGVYAKRVIDSGKFPLVDKIEIESLVKSTLSYKETIWGIYSRNFPSVTGNHFRKKTGMNLNDEWKNLYTTSEGPDSGKDFRREFWFGYDSGKDGETCVKLVNYEFLEAPNEYNASLTLGINLIRIPEMYYIMAEALLEENPVLAREYMDQVLVSRGMTAYRDRVPEQQLVLEDIMLERRKEYYAEGQEWFSMKRLNKDIYSVLGATLHPGSDDIYRLRIPDEEFSARN